MPWNKVNELLDEAGAAQTKWAALPQDERLSILSRWIELIAEKSEDLCRELTMQMGRPCSEAPEELEEFVLRSKRVLEMTPQVMVRSETRTEGTVERYTSAEPLGVVMVEAGWNYPYIICAHSVVPALAVGNAVLLSASNQTPTCSQNLCAAFREAGGPEGVLEPLFINRAVTERLFRSERISQVVLTGALPTEEVKSASQRRYLGLGLDLGGKDPAYVRADADLELAARRLAKAAFTNAGQSCCGVERIYVHESVHDPFLEALKSEVENLVLGDPRKPETTLGPMVRFQSAAAVYDQVSATINQGARPLLPDKPPERAYFNPQILADVDQTMKLMTEETFGPAVGVMRVAGDQKAIELMADCKYALGTSIWTKDVERGLELVRQINTYDSSVNYCDYLDPAIAFLGVKGSQRGFTLSRFGFEMLTRSRTYWIDRGNSSAS